MSATAFGQITSTFDSDVDGWQVQTFVGGLTLPVFNSSGGNPGGYASAVTPVSNTEFYYWVAPAKFLGNVCSVSYGQYLHFDMELSTIGLLHSSHGDVILKGGSTTIVINLPALPTTSWQTFNVKLDETTAWHLGSPIGALATKTEILLVISNLNSIQINGDYIGFPTISTTKIDNIRLDQEALGTPPVITSFAPATGVPGVTSVTINGTHFNATASNNIVYFGSVKATPLSASPTQLSVTVPPWAILSSLVVVDRVTGLSAASPKLFQPIFNNNGDNGGQIIRASLDVPVQFDVSNTTQAVQSMVVGDIDGDGRNDIVAGEVPLRGFSVFRNAGLTNSVTIASFDAKVTFTVTNSSGKGFVTLADFDGDGKLDVALTNANSLAGQAYISVFHNTSSPGSLSFDPAVDYLAFSYSDGPVQAADLDGDGRPEIISVYNNSCGTNNVYVLPNRSTPGDIQFCGYQVVATASTCGGFLSVGDLDGDRKPEIIVQGGFSTNVVSIIRNTSSPGMISMAPSFQVETTLSFGKVVIADLDNDGRNDLAYAGTNTTKNIIIRKNNYASGTLSASDFGPVIYLTSSLNGSMDDLSVGDINGDGKPDLIVCNDSNLAIFENTSAPGTLDNSSFYQGVAYAVGLGAPTPYAPLVADIDGDNKPEVIVETVNGAGKIFVYRNTSFPAPRVDNVTPLLKGAGASLTVTGANFKTGVTPPPPTSRVDLLSSSVAGPTNTSLTTTIPSGASSGKIAVTSHGLTGYSLPYDIHFGTNRVIDNASFNTQVDFSLSGTVQNAIAVSDLDNDGKPDVGAIDNSNTIRLFRNTTGTPGETITASSLTVSATTLAGGSFSLTSFDIDGDGLPDISSSQIYRNTSSPGSFSFGTGVNTASSSNISYAIADFNKDGKIDLTGTGAGLSVPVQSNMSVPGVFTFNGAYSTMASPTNNLTKPGANGGIATADFDGDGFDDIVVTSPTMANFTIFRNAGLKGPITSASFAAGTNVSLTASSQPYSLAVADFDADGKPDVAIVYHNQSYFSVFLNTSTTGNISFGPDTPFTTNFSTGFNIAAQDLDGDGKAEVVIINRPAVAPNSFDVFQNTSTPGLVSFGAAVNFPVSRFPSALSIADINGDEKPDILIVGTGASNALMVFQNLIPIVTITITLQPSDVSICEGGTASFNVAATGTTNITYQWQHDPNTGTFSNISNGSGFSGVQTSQLDVNTTGSFGDGRYRCRISGDFAASVDSNDEGLFINALPSSPATTPATVCVNTTASLFASGGIDGQYRWYMVSTGGTPIIGEENAAYVTPILTTTTTFYVSINDGTCESPRTSVTATTLPIPSAPTVTPATICTNASATLTAAGGANGQYRWYTTSTGGSPIAAEVNNTYTTPLLAANTTYYVSINDGTCESSRTPVTAKVQICATNAPPIINVPTLQAQVEGKITLNLTTLISDPDGNLDLSTLSIVTPPVSGAAASIDADFNLILDYNGIAFSGTDQLTLGVCDLDGSCTSQDVTVEVAGDIVIYNAVAPNGFELNRIFRIEYIDFLSDTKVNHVTIYNRWGDTVYETDNYDNVTRVFTGLSKSGKELPSGTYLYKITFSTNHPTVTGFLMLKR